MNCTVIVEAQAEARAMIAVLVLDGFAVGEVKNRIELWHRMYRKDMPLNGIVIAENDRRTVESIRVSFPDIKLVVLTQERGLLPPSNHVLLLEPDSWASELEGLRRFLSQGLPSG